MTATIGEIFLRCRRCRRLLYSRKDNCEDSSTCCKTFSSFESVVGEWNCFEDIPEWLRAALNENEWRKGKLVCPECKGKVGSFNFITPQRCACSRRRVPPIYLYKCKIDVCPPSTNSSNSMYSYHQKSKHEQIGGSPSSQMDSGTMGNEVRNTATEPYSSFFQNHSVMDTAFKQSTTRRSHRKSHSWHASRSMVSSWLASTFAEVPSHVAEVSSNVADETKHLITGTLNSDGNTMAAPFSSPIRQGHRKTKSWSGSIRNTLSTFLGLFPNETNPRSSSRVSVVENNEVPSVSLASILNSSPVPYHQLVPEKELEIMDPEGHYSPFLNVSSGKNTPFRRAASRKEPRSRGRISRRKKPRIFLAKSEEVHVGSSIGSRLDRSRSSSVASLIPDCLLCSVCLDILCLPRYCLPCRHVFCEPCLKLLTSHVSGPINRTRTHCPLCRQIIRWTETASDLLHRLHSGDFSARYGKRVLEYRRQSSMDSLVLPGLYQLKFIWRMISFLPDPIACRLETLWVDYTPLVTLYSFCIILLCILFFFILFLPGVYFTSCVWKIVESFTNGNDVGPSVIYQEAIDFGLLVAGSGMIFILSIIVFVSVGLYALFVM